eukprot:Gb_30372 [translate_table: standard]
MGKHIVAEVTGCLKLFSDESVERVCAGKDDINNPIARVPASHTFVDGVATRDVQIDSQTGVWARIYFPETSTVAKQEKLPIVIYFHGGGFCMGSADWRLYDAFCRRFVKNSRVICVSVNYRLAPEHRLPAACEDGFQSLLWLRAVARGENDDAWLIRYGDFRRCILMGESAGGNLVNEVAIRAGNDKKNLNPLCLCGGVMIHPGFVREQRSRSEVETPPDAALNLEMVDKFLNLSLPEGSTKDHPVTCPMGPLATPLQHLRLPPILVTIGDKDLIRDTQLEYCEAMKQAGKMLEMFVSKGVGHAFHLSEIENRTNPNTSQETTNLMDAIDSFIKKFLPTVPAIEKVENQDFLLECTN